MDQVLQGCPGTQCYLDDIIVTGENDSIHLENLACVLKRLGDYELRARHGKCELFKSSITYCGHQINTNGLPTVLYPLNALLQAGKKWMWTKQCAEAFQEAKRLVMSDTVLTHFDPHKPMKLACDASPYGIGVVLSHVRSDGTERPIAFASSSLSTAEKNYAQIDREALSLPLVSIFSPQKGVPLTAAARLQRWALFLGGHRYRIEFKRHANADGLSRLPLDLTSTESVKESIPLDVFTLAQLEGSPVTAEMVQRETRKDPTLSQVVIIPPNLRTRVLEELYVGHLGVVKMKSLARSFVWWPGIDQQIEQLAMHCSGCQHVPKMPKAAPLHAWEWPALPWQRIHVDFAGPFMGTTFLIVVDACTKWPEVFSMTSTTASQTVTVLRELFARTGVPEQLVSDNGPQFVSAEFQVFLKNNGIKHVTSAPYHPATNGLAERFVQSLKNALPHATTNRTPAMLFLGRPLRSRLDLLKPNLKRTVQDKQLKQSQGGGKTRKLEVGDSVLARDYRGDHKWMSARIKERTGPLSYTVEVAPDILWRQHIDQLRSSNVPLESVPVSAPVSVPSTPAVSATNGSDMALPPEDTVTPCKAPQSPVPTCEKRRYPTCIRKPPNCLDL
ncbi:hypothetical protein H4Q32_028458 [Labeo rohita]|uniref:Gypsy retrotransposon integrase-like protein 1 n=1 Tax=Labeo rohita TaxID=84645 RepID=A0ABQ8L5K8_LABRO|nr:hypothetical protein H4Q32_028458 [Labeo rohita]